MNERPGEWADEVLINPLPLRTVVVSRSAHADPVAERLRAAGWTVIWAPSPSALRVDVARSAEG